jgi:hypothetical protein
MLRMVPSVSKAAISPLLCTTLAFMSNSFSKGHCYFQASDNEDASFDIGLDLRPGTPMKEADAYRFACNPRRTRREQEFLTRDAAAGLW